MSPSSTCPSPSELRAFAVGDLSASAVERCALHVEECPDCAEALGRIDEGEDPFVRGLRGLGAEVPEDAGADPLPGDLLETARSATRSSAAELFADPARRIADEMRAGPLFIDRFELLEELGAGSFGYVYKARDSELDRTVAVKVLRGLPRGAGPERERFWREARSAAALEHPGIVHLFETGETREGVPYLVTEYVPGVSLEEHLRRGRPDAREAARTVQRVAEALHYAHEHGVVHRDVKPANILLDAQGAPHVADFGLAKRDSADSTVTPDDAIVGTPAYLPPELARGLSHAADARCDVYSLGVVLYELLTGERPFQGNRRMVLLQVLEEEPRPPRRLDERVPRDLEVIALKAMAKQPARRYASARELAEDLARYLAGEPIRARAMGVFERSLRWCRRNPLPVSLLGALSVGTVSGLAYLSDLSTELVRQAAEESAAQYAEMLEVVNDLYSSDVVERVGHHGVRATAEYAAAEGSIPLPATLLTVLLERISDGETGMSGRHYSEFPFKTRTNGGPQDTFEWDALRHLTENPDEPYKVYVDDCDGRPALIYATARRMLPSCVACHNSHPDSTKRDWEVGDVRGVLKIIRPLESDQERVARGLRGSFVLVGSVTAVLFGLSGLLLLATRRRQGAVRRGGGA